LHIQKNMRVKISLKSPETSKKENHLLSVPNNLKYILDLEVHLIAVLDLEQYLARNNLSISLSIDGFNLPKKEKIANLITEKDLIK